VFDALDYHLLTSLEGKTPRISFKGLIRFDRAVDLRPTRGILFGPNQEISGPPAIVESVTER
jgi:hypothetical protein